MLKMKIDGAKTVEIVVTGTIPDICAEILLGVKEIKEKIGSSNEAMGEAFIDTLKHGLDFIGEFGEPDDNELEDMINEVVDKALEDDKFLEKTMKIMPDELKADFVRRLKKRAKKSGEEEVSKENEG